MLTLTHFAGFGGDPDYRAGAVTFDGVNDWLNSGNYNGVVNGKSGTASFWAKLNGSDGTDIFIHNDSTGIDAGYFQLRRYNNNKWGVIGYPPSGVGPILFAFSNTTYSTASNPGWHHVLIAWDLGTGYVQIYVDDIADLTPSPIVINNVIQYSLANHFVGSGHSGLNKLNADVADIWIACNQFVDITVMSNRRRFIDVSGRPVYLGANGELPTGSQPTVFLSGSASVFAGNRGYGGGFTANDPLTNSPTSPSD